ncbi:2-amino-3,7-dideoxy-D-threo-hept-6-ulosonate synthase [Frankia casuarinae]|uniref:2-amino-3,7-dideoxy-D-threo-hept-6-ulosonate synthase n=1 Tax=Frankia casuarinae (strain DSM 45818 / CECT 9043 / HFP020203 / CcI3) TaxID=106370 RepID=Q2J589_FRACC|nr:MULTISPECIES: 2-amino-3,7-dideoxy-D-threo-hept-6-ulosonate synthase [Frankia]ABD13553.1 2-amino-3,7-dideoxy-D-threo-hept-6-ulosonate synthase [Frankia casuarinae]ETA00993.1 2-amino-3,7-dideoxy-D-threo-hept-6-ulosonate synthase [Frankia sp. CcI6]EYT90633.1 2-amino-3,7-dideoxy-D-threo-hept-6-ulosonate synthase [Frankia casuarinae]KFB02762.1 2-amino-3,7-dideoxy-D-threo-hept-6-ulosonate synthase [Frankia sp. Allo2]
MTEQHFARALRMARLHRWHPARLAITPLDHSISDGPVVPRGTTIDGLAGQLVEAGVDAIVVHKGSLRHLRPARLTGMSVIVHLNASTAHAPDPDAKYLVTGVEEALRLGADAVSLHVNLGSLDERQQIGDLGRVAERCEQWNLPLLAMMYPRGPRISDPHDPELIAHAVTLAVDLGADLVKAPFPGSVPALRDLTDACPVPLLCAGGPRRSEDDVLAYVRDVLHGGAAGVAMGRSIFQADDPRRMAAAVAQLVHAESEPRLEPTAEGQRSERKEAVLA